MKKRIALITWHHTENYGTAFQAYALSRLIEQSGCTVDLIEYRRLGTSPLPRRTTLRYILGGLHLKLTQRGTPVKLYQFKKETFDDFWRKYFKYTRPCQYNQDFRELNSIYDGFVCGSDQIWGPEWFDARFFLDFVEDEKKLIAYSPSIGVSSIEDGNVRNEMSRLIRRFPHLSLREKTGCKVVREMTGRNDVFNTLDPVLTLPVREWNIMEENVDGLPNKYFFIFFLKNNEENIKKSIEIAKEQGCIPIVLHCTQSEDTPYANTGDLTPGQLLTYLKHASYVCTDSFHMTVLSIIYEKSFKVFKKNAENDKSSKNNRITDLLTRLGINNSEYGVNSSFDGQVDYKQVNSILESLRKQSYDYLKNAIESLPKLIDDSQELLKCEGLALTKGSCCGEQTVTFVEWGKKHRKPYDTMSKYPFSLEDKCYRCQYYKGIVALNDNRKPLFWQELNGDFKKNKSIAYLFIKYYLTYYFSDMLHK